MTIPTPFVARCPRCAVWKGVRAPTAGEVSSGSQENVHMGATMTRFFRVRERMVSGRKRVGVLAAVGLRAAPGKLAGVKKGVLGALVALDMVVCVCVYRLVDCNETTVTCI
jgi:hypothetical protein